MISNLPLFADSRLCTFGCFFGGFWFECVAVVQHIQSKACQPLDCNQLVCLAPALPLVLLCSSFNILWAMTPEYYPTRCAAAAAAAALPRPVATGHWVASI
jgi:heme/copper-type cytochrome/quinol oxidase subunit 3